MTITVSEISYLARLARLEISRHDIEHYTQDIANILQLVARMQQLDTREIVPLSNPLESTQRLREDQVTETDVRELMQSLAPQVADGYYLVPKVIDDE